VQVDVEHRLSRLPIAVEQDPVAALRVAAFGGDLGAAYLGTQGDVWDAQKDMALAAAGAVVGAMLMALRAARPRRK